MNVHKLLCKGKGTTIEMRNNNRDATLGRSRNEECTRYGKIKLDEKLTPCLCLTCLA